MKMTKNKLMVKKRVKLKNRIMLLCIVVAFEI